MRLARIGSQAPRNTIRNLFLVTLALLLAGSLCAFAEAEAPESASPVIRTSENAEIDRECPELTACSITFRNTRAYAPEDFNLAKVVETDYQRSEYGPGSDIYFYRYADDARLSVGSDTSLLYGNRDADRYSQLLTYLENAQIEPDQAAAAPFPLEDAQERCWKLFSRLHIGMLVPDRAVALPAGYIRELTEGMRELYRGAEKPAAFTDFPGEIGAWYLTFRQELNGLPSAGVPQVTVVLTEKETALLELNRIIDHVNDDYELTAGASWVDAMRLFSAAHSQKAYADENYSESFEISRINLAYDYDFQGREEACPLDARTFPCWCIEGKRAVTLTEGTNVQKAGTKEIPFSEIYRIPDGKMIMAGKSRGK